VQVSARLENMLDAPRPIISAVVDHVDRAPVSIIEEILYDDISEMLLPKHRNYYADVRTARAARVRIRN
jgi:hypothetical protein